MKGKWTYLILLVCLAAFGYLFILNPTQVPFRLFRGAPVRTNLALVVFLAFLSGFGVAFATGLGKETVLSLRFWRQRRRDASREKGRSLSLAGRGLLAVERPGPAA
ncbi:MAG: hypothetical protein HGA98_06005, partial [Deltaproteobacteria bacterium]|nr:hypothetical protein [Deltaproteobacteria bacterium]